MVRVTRAVQLTLLLLLSTHLQVGGGDRWDLEEEYRDLQEKRLFSCKNENDSCRGFPRCCGELACYWVGGYSPFRPGVCVMCIGNGLACQTDSGCCAGMVCDSNDKLNINGICSTPRTSGACYRNDQCLHHCERPYYKSKGYCTAEPVVNT